MGKAEHIDYTDQDEMGDLIKQYNLMVDELESAVKLPTPKGSMPGGDGETDSPRNKESAYANETEYTATTNRLRTKWGF